MNVDTFKVMAKFENLSESRLPNMFLSSHIRSAFGLTLVLSCFNFLKGIIKWIMEMNGQQLVVVAVLWLHHYPPSAFGSPGFEI